MKITVVTTFNSSGYEKYGKRMIETFLKNWPSTINLLVYAEDCVINQHADNLTVIDLHLASPELVKFKETWGNVPKARGWCTDSTQKFNDKTQQIGFKWDAVRFSHKVYAIFHAAKNCNSDVLFWMDADTVCHSKISQLQVEEFCKPEVDLGFLGRDSKYTECGLYSLNLQSAAIHDFLSKFQEMYDNAPLGIFTLQEWHDSFVFDHVRLSSQLVEDNWSAGIVKGEGHPLINSKWGAWLDHLKGDRKSSGKSNKKDLKISRNEEYWQ
jgi:hypothetical protein